MAYEHNPDLPLLESVLDHRPPRLWVSGVLEVVKVSLEEYESETGMNVEEFLQRYSAFQKHEKPALPSDPVIRARGFWDVPDEQFDGHFPSLPVLQGVQQLEAVGQLGAYAAMYEEPGELGVFLNDSVSQHLSPVPQGETLFLSADILGRQGKIFVGVGSAALLDGAIVSTTGVISGKIMKKKVQESLLQRATEAIKAQSEAAAEIEA